MTVDWLGPASLRRPAELVGLRIYHRVTHLSLRGPKYDDAAIEHVAKLTSLKSLSLSDTSITSTGMRRLRQALPDCQIEHKPL